ncbi:unnamed protein product, partial [Owenia fusiformis]
MEQAKLNFETKMKNYKRKSNVTKEKSRNQHLKVSISSSTRSTDDINNTDDMDQNNTFQTNEEVSPVKNSGKESSVHKELLQSKSILTSEANGPITEKSCTVSLCRLTEKDISQMLHHQCAGCSHIRTSNTTKEKSRNQHVRESPYSPTVNNATDIDQNDSFQSNEEMSLAMHSRKEASLYKELFQSKTIQASESSTLIKEKPCTVSLCRLTEKDVSKLKYRHNQFRFCIKDDDLQINKLPVKIVKNQKPKKLTKTGGSADASKHKRVSCEICSKVFANNASLYTHNIIHGEKKFKCDICGK